MVMGEIRLVAVGDELLSGAVADTNSSFLAAGLRSAGFTLAGITVVGDEIDVIVGALKDAARSAAAVIVTGGLGPTSDDITRDGIARFLGRELLLREESLQKLKDHSLRRGRPFNENNARQAYFPRDAQVFSNPVGTADWFICETGTTGQSCWVASLPGVPRELKEIFTVDLLPWLSKRFFEVKPHASKILKCFGHSEAYIGSVIEKAKLPAAIKVGYRPVFPEVWLTLSSEGSKSEVEKAASTIKSALGAEFVFGEDLEETLASKVGELLKAEKKTLACAESCSGGLLAHRIVACPGASEWFLGSLVTYSNRAKEVFLGIRPEMLELHGAVSGEVATAMALHARDRLGADFGISITGIAGPGGATSGKPVGSVFIGIASAKHETAFFYNLPFDRNGFRAYCAELALDLLRRELSGLPLEWERK